ncbi:MAG: Pr6Pr family membrane protein [Clostridia bacterium]|nr:Pr6Pr family membrane protein [Clostridia bacterium]
MINNLLTQMIYRIILCCVSALAVLLTFNIFYVGQGANDLTWEFLKFYTNISNYFVFAVSVIVLADTVKRVRNGEKYGYVTKVKTLKFMVTVMILVTFLVYAILLGDPISVNFWRNIGNLSYHVFAPVLFILDYFLFDEHKTHSVFAPLYSLIIPLIYVGYIFILGAAIDNFEYPYFFLDVNDLGYGGVMVWVLILLVVFTVLGYLMWLYNRLVKVDGKWKLDFSGIRKAKVNAVEQPDSNSDGTEN